MVNPQISSIIGAYSSGSIEILTEVEILQSPSVLMPIFNKVKEQKRLEGRDTSEWTFIAVKENFLKIERQNKTSILNISYLDKEKKIILDVLNDISNEYRKYSTIDRTKHIEQGLKFLEQQINIYKNEFVKSNKKILTFALKNDLPSGDLREQRGLRIEGKNNYDVNDRAIYANNIRVLKDMQTYFKTIKDDEENLFSVIYLLMNIQTKFLI